MELNKDSVLLTFDETSLEKCFKRWMSINLWNYLVSRLDSYSREEKKHLFFKKYIIKNIFGKIQIFKANGNLNTINFNLLHKKEIVTKRKSKTNTYTVGYDLWHQLAMCLWCFLTEYVSLGVEMLSSWLFGYLAIHKILVLHILHILV